MARKVLWILLLAAFLVGLPSQLVILVEDPGAYPYIVAAERRSADVRRAMRYHGTDVAYSEDGRTWFFRDRDGRQCRLFTKDCLASLASKGNGAS